MNKIYPLLLIPFLLFFQGCNYEKDYDKDIVGIWRIDSGKVYENGKTSFISIYTLVKVNLKVLI